MLARKQIFDLVRLNARSGIFNMPANVMALDHLLDDFGVPNDEAVATAPLAWGAKVTPEFRARARGVASNIGVDPSDFMTCMAWESGRTFKPDVKNMAGSGATGLIQFMPKIALALGTSVAALAKMSAVQQLDWVEKYFQPYKGKLRDLGDLYMAILWPGAIGKPPEFVLWDEKTRPTTYRQNAGLDLDKDGDITKAECCAKLFAMKAEGQRPENVA